MRRLLVSSILVLTVLSFCDPANAQGPQPQTVRADPIRRQKVQGRKLVTGEIRSAHRSNVAAEEPGRIDQLPVREGQRVEKGQLLVQLKHTRLELELAINDAEASVASSTQVEAETRHKQAERDLQSIKRLDAKGAANPKELADATTAVETAAAQLESAKRQVTLVETRKALVATRLEDMTIRAPFAGVVVTRHKDLGEWVSQGDAIVELLSTTDLESWISVPQDYLPVLTRQSVRVSVKVHATGQSFDATEFRVVPNVDRSARGFPVIVPVPEEAVASGGIAPGMSVSAWVPVGKESEQLTVQKDAVLRSDTGAFIYVARAVGAGKSAIMVPVSVSFSLGDRLVIEAAGLEEGDLAIVEGNESLYPMAPVAPFVKGADKP